MSFRADESELPELGLQDVQKLQLALNNAHTGRTFEDRFHIFNIRKRAEREEEEEKEVNVYNICWYFVRNSRQTTNDSTN